MKLDGLVVLTLLQLLHTASELVHQLLHHCLCLERRGGGRDKKQKEEEGWKDSGRTVNLRGMGGQKKEKDTRDWSGRCEELKEKIQKIRWLGKEGVCY